MLFYGCKIPSACDIHSGYDGHLLHKLNLSFLAPLCVLSCFNTNLEVFVIGSSMIPLTSFRLKAYIFFLNSCLDLVLFDCFSAI